MQPPSVHLPRLPGGAPPEAPDKTLEVETTYVSTSKPTNQPTPTTYLSIRITLPHSSWGRIFSIVADASYIAYPHTGMKTQKEHWHVLIPSDKDSDAEKYRKRCKKLGLSGQEQFTITYRRNGLLAGIQYVSKERTTPKFTPDMEQYITSAPPWVDHTTLIPEYMSKDTKGKRVDLDWQLTYGNIVYQAVKHAEKYQLKTSLKDVVQHLIEHTRWRPSNYMVTKGVPEYYQHDFEFRMKRRTRFDMGWWDPSH